MSLYGGQLVVVGSIGLAMGEDGAGLAGECYAGGGSIKSGRKTGRQFSRRGAGGRGGHALMGWLEDGDGKGWRLVGDGSLQINPETQAATATGERGARAGARGQGRAKGRTGQWEPGQWFSAPQKREG